MTQSSFPKTVRMKWNDGASDTSLYVMYGKQGAGDGAMEGWNFRHISMCSGMEMDKLGVSLTETLRMEGGWMKLMDGASVTISSLVEGRLINWVSEDGWNDGASATFPCVNWVLDYEVREGGWHPK